MKIIIVGAGEVGFHLAKKLSFEKHDLVIVEENPEQCKKMEETPASMMRTCLLRPPE